MGFNKNSSVVKRYVLKNGTLIPEEQHLREIGQLMDFVRPRLDCMPGGLAGGVSLGGIVEAVLDSFDVSGGNDESQPGGFIEPYDDRNVNDDGRIRLANGDRFVWRYNGGHSDFRAGDAVVQIPPAGPSHAQNEARLWRSAEAQGDLQDQAEQRAAERRANFRPRYHVQTSPVYDNDEEAERVVEEMIAVEQQIGTDERPKKGNTATLEQTQESDDSLDNLLQDMDNLINE